MRLADFEQMGKIQYNNGFKAAMEAVIKLMEQQIPEECLNDDNCSDPGYAKMQEVLEGIKLAKSNIS